VGLLLPLRRRPGAARAALTTLLGEPTLGHAIVGAVALQRGVEALVSARNLARLRARGGVRAPRDGTAALVGLHVAWFAAMVAERVIGGARMPPAPLAWAIAVPLLAVEAVRAWILATLRSRWTIQVVVLPGEVPVRRGPYRYLRHPNYAVVLSEVVLVSALVGAWGSGLLAVLAAALLLRVRVRVEERAWRSLAAAPLRGA
jgi:methyltransferase